MGSSPDEVGVRLPGRQVGTVVEGGPRQAGVVQAAIAVHVIAAGPTGCRPVQPHRRTAGVAHRRLVAERERARPAHTNPCGDAHRDGVGVPGPGRVARPDEVGVRLPGRQVGTVVEGGPRQAGVVPEAQRARHANLADLGLGHHREAGRVAVVIQQQVQLDSPLGAGELGPVEQRHRQVDQAGIQTHELVLEAKLLRATLGVDHLPGPLQQLLEDGLKQLPRSVLGGARITV
jgi:hypothetical protein